MDPLLAEFDFYAHAKKPIVVRWSLTPGPGVLLTEHVRGVTLAIRRALQEVWRVVQERPTVLLASPELMAVLDALPISLSSRSLSIWGLQIQVEVRTWLDDEHPVPRGEGWLLFATEHVFAPPRGVYLPFGRKLGRPVAIIQIEEEIEHPLVQLARCAL